MSERPPNPRHGELSRNARHVLDHLREMAHPVTGQVWPSNAELSARAGMTNRSARNALTELAKAGLIERAPGDGPRTYTVHAEPTPTPASPGDA
jgi:DNA-binding FadR family transcriptional regulator